MSELVPYRLSLTILLDEALPENDYDVLRKRIQRALREEECIDIVPNSFRLTEAGTPSERPSLKMPGCRGCADGECHLHLGTPSHLGDPSERPQEPG